MIPPRLEDGAGTRPLIILAVRLVVFISEAYFASIFSTSALLPFSWSSIAGWSIGLTFGIVITVWRATTFREAARFRSLAFLAASALIWILVVQLMNRNIKPGVGIDDRIFYGSVALGTVLLTIAHAQLLGTSWTRTLIAIPGTLGVWLLAGRYPLHNVIVFDPDAVSVWQAAYILFMFGSAPIVASAVVIVTALTVFPIVPRTQRQNIDWCVGNVGATPDQRISGCTAVIQSGKTPGKGLGFAFHNRGIWYYDKGEYDRAIADFDQAIQRDPYDRIAFNNRGNVYSDKGEYDRAIADYDHAIRLNPNYADALKNRGRTHFYKGDFTAAAADLLRANKLAADAYTMLLRFLALGRTGQDGAAELSANATRLKNRDWPYPVIDFYLGRRTLDEFRAAAITTDQKCEVAFYSGQWDLLRGEKAAARTMLQNAADTCPKNFIEYTGALVELKRVNPY